LKINVANNAKDMKCHEPSSAFIVLFARILKAQGTKKILSHNSSKYKHTTFQMNKIQRFAKTNNTKLLYL